MQFQSGDPVLAEAESTNQAPRRGIVQEVLRADPGRYRIRWEDGRETIYTPSAGALRPDPTRRRKTRMN